MGKFFLDGEDGKGDWEKRAVQLRGAHCKLLKDGGLVDAWRYHNPRRKEFTSFQETKAGTDRGMDGARASISSSCPSGRWPMSAQSYTQR